ncbi:NAD-dependent epimerase/dehydratase family protein [Elongatibacter sediminis]|uniref:NAD(P)-dependent oxidoreductase n=1 Tax=Elongatibacter sediminis TaxID=3119006 RepID=A0AAW9RCP5_9GAMM
MPAEPASHHTVFLTGATGFIGRHIQATLLGAGCTVRALVRPGSANAEHVDPRCQAVEAALSDGPALERAVADCTAVIYCAGSVRGRVLDDFLPANEAGVRQLMQALAGVGPPPPTLLISSLAAGQPELSDYAQSKLLGEQALRRYAPGGWTILRPPAVYGPGDREMRPILRMARSGWIAHAGPASQRVSLIHAADLARAVLAWLHAWPASAGRLYTLDDGREGGYDWHAIAAAAGRDNPRLLRVPTGLLRAIANLNLGLSRLLGYPPMLTPGKVEELTQADWLCDNTALSADTGWQPRIELAQGLRQTLDDFRSTT